MKSPFVTEQKVETYAYPDPLKEPPAGSPLISMIDQEVLEAAKEPGEESPWIKFRVPMAKSDVDAIADLTQSIVTGGNNGGLHYESRIAIANRGVFELLCEGWSFTDNPSVEDYDRLDKWASVWIVACLEDAMSKGSLAAGIAAKKTPPSSESSGSASSRPRARTRAK